MKSLDTKLAALAEDPSRPDFILCYAADPDMGAGLRPTVAAGGQDHVCAALALGVTEPGMVLDSIGTAEAFLLVTEAVDPAVAFGEAGIDQGAHVEPDRTYALTGPVQGGGSRNIRLIERKRAIGGRPIDIAPHLEATALGAARLARRAIEKAKASGGHIT